jgi:tripartite-type tricarboxylate transporter receptor subunit TctC
MNKQVKATLSRFMFAALGAAVISFGYSPADAAYPEKPITLVVPVSAGGGMDAFARIVAKYSKKHIGQKMIVKNRPGAGGQRAINELVKAEADGYEIAAYTFTAEAFQPQLRPAGQTGYQRGDLIWVSTPSVVPSALFSRKGSDIKDLAAFIKKAKANPGKIILSQTGRLSVPAAFRMMIEKELNITTAGLNYKGGGKMFKAFLGKEVEILNANIMFAKRAPDRLIPLAIASSERHPIAPNAPTFKELGFDIQDYLTRSIVVAKGTPQNIISHLDKGMQAMCKDSGFRADLKKAGLARTCWGLERTKKEQATYIQQKVLIIEEFKKKLKK